MGSDVVRRTARAELLATVELTALATDLLGEQLRCPSARHPRAGDPPAGDPTAGHVPTPLSITVRPGDRRRWRCPACGEGGTALDLVALRYRCSTDEALEWLAAWQVGEVTRTAEPGAPGDLAVAGGGATAVPTAREPSRSEPALARPEPLTLVAGGRAVSVEVDPDATVEDLALALALDASNGLSIGGRVVPPRALLATSGLRQGVEVGPAPATERRGSGGADQPPVVELRWVAGLDAGRVERFAPGTWPLSTGGRVAAVLSVGASGEVTALELARGGVVTTESGRLELPFGVAVAGPPRPAAAPVPPAFATPTWTDPVIRPPAPPDPMPGEPDRLGDLALPPRPSSPSLVPAAVSLAGGVLLSMVLRQPLVLLMGAVGAIGTLGTLAWQRLRWRRDVRRARRAHAGEATAHAAALARHGDEVRAWWHRRHPDLAVMVERAESGDGLWIARLQPGESLAVAVGETAGQDPRPAPAVVALEPGRAVAVVGSAAAAGAVVRAMVARLAIAHGPADLSITARTSGEGWSSTTWLPHPDSSASEAGSTPGHLLVLDDVADLAVRTGPVRRLLAAGATAIVMARPSDALAHLCDTVITVDDDGPASVHHAAPGTSVPVSVRAAGLSVGRSARLARHLARWHDPEATAATAGLPTSVDLADVVGGVASSSPEAMARSWREGRGSNPRAVIGVAADGLVEVDLVHDGPHALVAGTTGSGKSELLRTLVASLALGSDPRDLAFLLVDYKGGSAFDACAGLPHVVGVITDLDEHLAERALRSLRAELRHREELLRAAGATDLAGYHHRGGDLPRLVVVVDEFATLAAELPGFLHALVGVAQRGRSLGVHLVLATQRPGHAVSDDIRANTNLRIALRVQDATESIDVVGTPAAARLRRDRPGAAVVRLGDGEEVVIQTARSTAPARPIGGPRARRRSLAESRPAAGRGGLTQLDELVDGARAAAGQLGLGPPRRPWLDPLPAVVDLADLPPGAVALADDPDHQCRRELGWQLDRGHLLLYGGAGSGTTTALATLAVDLARNHSPDDLQLLVADLGFGGLGALGRLPHTGAVVAAGERERIERLVRVLRTELDARSAEATLVTPAATPGRDRPRLAVLIDGLASLRAELESCSRYDLLDDLDRVLAEGPAAGIVMAITADRAGAVPAALAAVAGQRWVFQPADPGELGLLGLRPGDVPAWCPGRAYLCEHGLEAQLAWPGPVEDAVAAVAGRWAPPLVPPPAIGVLPALVSLASVRASSEGETVVIGIGDRALAPIGLRLHAGDHVLIAGPSRSGRSNGLAVVAEQLRAAQPRAWLGLVAPRSRPSRPDLYDGVGAHVADLTVPVGALAYLLVDDAELVDDVGGALAARLHRLDPDLHVVAAARPDALRAAYGHWTQLVRRSRLGVLLQPDPLLDADLLGVTLPRHRRPITQVGRGYVVAGGACDLAQLALARSAAVSVGPARTSNSAPKAESAPARMYASA